MCEHHDLQTRKSQGEDLKAVPVARRRQRAKGCTSIANSARQPRASNMKAPAGTEASTTIHDVAFVIINGTLGVLS
ncbi:MAG TPA: hypothetical protein VKK79_07410 [Candidatus Lokiarchaeia archaeon]|nr:hypothetical protein [Candidatus Lokiarchaeia archaeon]